jgi:hypothetical protein
MVTICVPFVRTPEADFITPMPGTFAKQEAMQNIALFFFPKGSFWSSHSEWTHEPEGNEPNPDPSPHYHALEGENIFMDWKLAFPKVDLVCFNCKPLQ